MLLLSTILLLSVCNGAVTATNNGNTNFLQRFHANRPLAWKSTHNNPRRNKHLLPVQPSHSALSFEPIVHNSDALKSNVFNPIGPFKTEFVHRSSSKTFQFEKLHIFGDSLSCTGNFLKFIANDIEVPPVYYDGRYTNGLLWHEYLLEETTLARQSENYAHAWATASDVCTRKSEERPAVPDLLSQLAVWEEKNPAISCRRNLYSIWIGGNDYVKKDLPFMSADKLEGMIQQAVQPIVQTMIRILAKDPCATFLLPTILPGEVLPVCPPIRRLKDKIGSIVDKHDWILDESLRSLAMVYNLPAERFIRVDVKSFMRQLVADPESFGFGSDLEPCIRTIETKKHQPTANSCADPERRIFIDEIHISTRVHRIIASMISQAVLNCCLDCDEC